MSGRMEELILISFFREKLLSSWYLRSLQRLVKATLNRSSIRSPASLRRLLA
jgi:hypothetical protein